MIPVNSYIDLWNYVRDSIPGIDIAMVVHEESDLALMIRDVALGSVLLIAVLPGSDMQVNNPDNYQEIDTCIVFMVKKSDRGSLLQAEYVQELAQMQRFMEQLKLNLINLSKDTDHLAPHSHLLHGLQIGTMHTDPEYNLLGCNGYGLSFKVKTNPLLTTT
jgi:hypothetical protein